MSRHRALVVLACAALGLAVGIGSYPACALTPNDLGLVINESDPLSVRIGEYYAGVRQIPPENILRVRIESHDNTLTSEQFARLKADLDKQTPLAVQAYALTWVAPYRVECMSITSAVAFGFDRSYCGQGCAPTRLSRYFDSESRRPYSDLGLRPTMSIAATNFDDARALIDRGLAASLRSIRAVPGTAYLVETDDVARNVRAASYADAKVLVDGGVPVQIVHTPALQNRDDVLFYFIGAVSVRDLATNHFVAGAVGDHLTSTGGDLLGQRQMSSLRWLEAGATGSFGTVVEPCNSRSKFPQVGLLMRRYLHGETLLEAYWKSVAMPGQGIFIGDPLATLGR
jgi:uncharacterized protein (TIGR03790 family)